MNTLTILDSGNGLIGLIGTLIYLAIIVALLYFTMGKTFEKAGYPWWSAIIPIYSIYIWLKIIGKPTWWLILMLIPLVNFIIIALMHIGMGKSFGKDTTFGILLFLIPFYNLYLWYKLGNNSDEKYYGPAGEGAEGFADFKNMVS
ncbi:signal peptidase I [Flavobacteriaceae bacterium UJ101]|nr:signal peptidase I [Flavobacteriaceae bacterium UJ101]